MINGDMTVKKTAVDSMNVRPGPGLQYFRRYW